MIKGEIFSLPSGEVVCDSLIEKPFDVARQIPRMPFCKVAKKPCIRTDMPYRGSELKSEAPAKQCAAGAFIMRVSVGRL
jgi:hypothetical protein